MKTETARNRVLNIVAEHVLGDDYGDHQDVYDRLVDALVPRLLDWLDDVVDHSRMLARTQSAPVQIAGDEVLPEMTDAEIEDEIDRYVRQALDEPEAPAPASTSAFSV